MSFNKPGIVRVGLHHQTENAAAQKSEADQSIEEVNHAEIIHKNRRKVWLFRRFYLEVDFHFKVTVTSPMAEEP